MFHHISYRTDRPAMMAQLDCKANKTPPYKVHSQDAEDYIQAVKDCYSMLEAVPKHIFTYQWLQNMFSNKLKANPSQHYQPSNAYKIGILASKSILSNYYHNKYDIEN